MKKLLVFPAIILFSVMLLCLFFKEASGQQTFTTISNWNAYVHLPSTYATTTRAYPTILFYPGLGEVGTVADKVIAQGPGAFIKQGWVGNVDSTEFIVISLQPSAAYPAEIYQDKAVQAIKKAYRVGRLFLTGLSHGGWCASTYVTGDTLGGNYYASQVTAVVTVEGMRPDDNQPYPNLWANFANAGGRYLGFEQKFDGRDTKTVVDRMNLIKPNSAIWVSTNFGSGGHCCWEQFYGGNGIQPQPFLLDGKFQNIYQWMASVGQREAGGTINPPPPPVPTQPILYRWTNYKCNCETIYYINPTDSTKGTWETKKLP